MIVDRRTASERLADEMEILAEDEKRPWGERHPFVPPLKGDGWTLAFITACERRYRANDKNPVFVSQARQAKKWLTLPPSPEVYEACLKWIDDHFDEVDRRLIGLAVDPPTQRDPAIAEALGFGPAKRGGHSEFAEAGQAWSDELVHLLVELRLRDTHGKIVQACEEVGIVIGQSETTVRRAHARHQKLMMGQ